MTGHCPRCRAVLDLPASGAYACPKCRRTFHAYVAAPSPTAALVPAQVSWASVPDGGAADAGGACCAVHANNLAAGACERCGDFMCILCETPLEGCRYCTRCFELLSQRGSFAYTQRTFTQPRLSLKVAGWSWLLFFNPFLSFVMVATSVVLALLALKRIGEQPDLPGRKEATAALVVGGLSFAAALLFWAGLFVYGSMRR